MPAGHPDKFWSADGLPNIGALSLINVEVWELTRRNKFRLRLTVFRTQSFISLLSFYFLSLISKPQLGKTEGSISLVDSDLTLFLKLQGAEDLVVETDKLSRQWKKKEPDTKNSQQHSTDSCTVLYYVFVSEIKSLGPWGKFSIFKVIRTNFRPLRHG